jgi:hypothetical protein
MGRGSSLAAVAATAIACMAAGEAAAHGFSVRVASAVFVEPVVSVKEVRAKGEWVPGHWEWQGDGHAWVPGHFTLPPRAYSGRDEGITTVQAPQPNEMTRY